MFAYVKFKIESGFYAEFINELIEKEIYIKNIRTGVWKFSDFQATSLQSRIREAMKKFKVSAA